MIAAGPDNVWSSLPRTTGVPPCVTRVPLDDPEIPAMFRAVRPRLRGLWVKGQLPAPGRRTVAMVGSRSATLAGCARARALAADLGRRGFAVASGGALGIDAAAHRGALDAGSVTYAVLGCGVDVVYPDRHRALFDELVAGGGGLLSEYPPGTPPRSGQFPVRNRLVAALGEGTVVVEARRHSGALITARLARAFGRVVLAVPGSVGADDLIHSGAAVPVACADDVLDALAGRAPAPLDVPPAFAALVDALGRSPDTAAGLGRRLGLGLPEVLGLLSAAEMDGWIRRTVGAMFEVARVD